MSKKIKTAFFIILCVALVALIILWRLSAGKEPAEKEEFNASCDYFNGEVVEITDEYFILKPIAEWTWKETTRVKIPKTDIAQKMVTLEIGDQVRVAFNSKAMEWKEDEALIPVAFAVYPLAKEWLDANLTDKNDTIAVIMEVSDVTPTGLTVHFRQYEKRDIGELIYGDGYWIERLEEDKWVELPVIPENPLFNGIGYLIPSEGEAQLAVDWEWLYGKLDSGTYRIVKGVTAREWSNSESQPLKCMLATQFEIAP